jgi:hypothetical protein
MTARRPQDRLSSVNQARRSRAAPQGDTRNPEGFDACFLDSGCRSAAPE